MTRALDLKDLERSIPWLYLERGEHYLESGRISQFRDSEANRLQAKVQGSRGDPYAVDVRLLPGRTGVKIYGLCSCPTRVNCKHVAAVLLHALRNGAGVPALRAAPSDVVRKSDPPTPVASNRAALPFQLRSWLANAERAATAQQPSAPRGCQRVLYCVYATPAPNTQRTYVRLMRSRLLKNGGYGGAKVWRNAREAVHNPPSFLLPEDARLLRWLLLDAQGADTDDFELIGEQGPLILRALLATGRCHFENVKAPLSEGMLRATRLQWEFLEDGTQRVVCAADSGIDRLLPLAPPHYIDLDRMQCGPLDTGLSPELAYTLASAPTVAPEEVAEVRRALTDRVAGAAAVLPQPLREVEVRATAPVPCLQLLTLQAYGRGYRPISYFLEISVLQFEYAGVRLHRDSPRKTRTFHYDKVIHIERDARAERRFHDRLKSAGMVPLSELAGDVPYEHARDYALRDPRAWPDFVFRTLPRLREEGWKVELDESFRFRPVEHGQWLAQVESAGDDWFDFRLGLELDGRVVDVLPLLFAALRARATLPTSRSELDREEPFYVRLDDGRLLPVPLERFGAIVSILNELLDAQPADQIRLSRLDAVRLADLERETAIQLRGDDELLKLGRRLADFAGIHPVSPPQGLMTELRPYQLHGLAWLQFLREYDLGGILADDMGLGKTVQTLAHILIEKEAGRLDLPALVIAPTSVIPNWKSEAARFAPDLRVHVSHGLKRRDRFGRFAEADVVLTTYPLLARDRETLTQRHFHLIVLDEAQQVKNAKTQSARVVSQISGRHRLCLTGTPLENHLGELWSLFQFLMPGYLGSAEDFHRLYRIPIEKRQDDERRMSLRRRIRPFLLRRTKDQVAVELPAKTEIVHAIELTGAQRDLYETVRVLMHERVRAEINARGLAQSQIAVLDALLKLRQICCDPRLVKLDAARKVTGSAKLDALLDMLEELLHEGRRVLLFSQFTSMLELIEEELKRLAIRYVKLTGDTRDRKRPVEAFQAGKVPLFLISLKAGGVGLNLAAADTVIHYDPWWNPAVERQATDRAHRIGQNNPVFTYKLIVTGSVEEKITRLQASKTALAAGILGEGNAANTELTAEQVAELFEPLA
ncbi:MAG: helicase SNF2 [Proteobacteria bacterium]|nr:MAG: helicase SNF2 [Pseudomonadota bacterium]